MNPLALKLFLRILLVENFETLNLFIPPAVIKGYESCEIAISFWKV